MSRGFDIFFCFFSKYFFLRKNVFSKPFVPKKNGDKFLFEIKKNASNQIFDTFFVFKKYFLLALLFALQVRL